jgi:hypothetical protein
MSKIKRTTRFSPQRVHNTFGIQNWLKKRKIFHEADCDKMVEMFCESQKFNKPAKHVKSAMYSFAQNRFDKFCVFVIEEQKKAEKATV